MDKWSSDKVFQWLQTEKIKLEEQDAKIFQDQDIDGSALLDFTEDRLAKDPFLLKMGPRMRIMRSINEFKSASGKGLLHVVE
jgi:hypothetical protein